MAFVKGTTGNTTTSPTTTTAFTGSTTSGNMIVVTVSDDSALLTNNITVTDNKGNTYLKEIHRANTSTLSMWYCSSIVGGSSHTVTATWDETATGRVTVVAQEFDGGHNTLDKKSDNQGSSTSPSSGATATTTAANETVVSGVSRAGTTSALSLGSGYTNLGTVNVANAGVGQESKVVSSTGAQTGTFSIAASRAWVCGVLTFKAGVTNVNITQASSTSTTQALALNKSVQNVQASSSSTAQAITIAKNVSIGIAAEADTVQSLSSAKSSSVGQATETDTSQPLALNKTVSLTQPTETDTAQGLTTEEVSPSGDPPEFMSVGSYFENETSSPAFDAPDGVVAGDIILVVAYIDMEAAVTDMPDGFSEAPGSPSAILGESGRHSNHVMWKRATGSDTGTYDFILDTSVFVNGAAIRYQGAISSGDPWDTDTDAAQDLDNISVTPAVSITTTGPNRTLIHTGTCWAGGTWTPTTGFTKRVQGGFGLITESDTVQSSAGSTGSVTATTTQSDKRTAWLGALLPEPAAGDEHSVGLVEETDTSNLLTVDKQITTSVSITLDTVQSLTADKQISIGLVTETDTANAVHVVGPRKNLCSNPALGANDTGWRTDGTSSRVAVSGFSRPFAYQVTAAVFAESARAVVDGSKVYSISCEIKASAAGTIAFYIGQYRSDGSDAGAGGPFNIPVATNTVTTLSGTITSRSDAAFIAATPVLPNGTEIYQVTSVLIEETDAPSTYADGETDGWVWDGVQYNSTSSESSVVAIDIGLSVEADTSNAITLSKSIEALRSDEIDSAQVVVTNKVITIGLASEIDSGAVTGIKREVQAGIALASESSQVLSLTKTLAIAQSQETNVAFATTLPHIISILPEVSGESIVPILNTTDLSDNVIVRVSSGSTHSPVRVSD